MEIKINDNILLHYIPMEKLKTTTLSLSIHRQLCEDDASKNALIPYVLKRGCKLCPNLGEISKYLENLYGANLGTGVSKMGEDQVLGFYLESISDRYAPEKEPLLSNLTALMLSVVFEPVTENGGFSEEFVNQERNNLKDRIDALVNDKRSYAMYRCAQEMCHGEPFRIYKLGTKEALDEIEPKSLYNYYQTMISSSKIDIYVCGDTDIEKVEEKIREYVQHIDFVQADYPKTQLFKQDTQVKTVEESMDVTQGKLSLGFRTSILPTDEDYFALVVANSILGGGAHSKLFNNVREKLSLAYYASSQLEKYKGLMLVNAGIEFDKFQAAYDEILAQLKELQDGEISDLEYESSIQAIINALQSYYDDQRYMESYYLGEQIAGTSRSIEKYQEKIKAVTKEQAADAAKKIKLDTVYFLKGDR